MDDIDNITLMEKDLGEWVSAERQQAGTELTHIYIKAYDIRSFG